ncbi:hypothetical protein ACL00S_17165 [Curtobacterium flaccumfaciens]|uniref:hypothetical protein n=1 Tax=Curtobacterium flaccumfaciens TaxID=2035 RepID=UPI00265817F2|nr:hypothetical protein [Curtobacterium flaccumfaciens]MCS5521423.1 hypothetical protein [Curtobacterium flaccumfaciens pv. oortii]
MKASGDDDRPARARYNLLFGGILLVVGVVLLAVGWNLVAGVIFTFVGGAMLAGWLFQWSRKDRARKWPRQTVPEDGSMHGRASASELRLYPARVDLDRAPQEP